MSDYNSDFFDELQQIYDNSGDSAGTDGSELLDELNEEQMQAVTHLDGPLLILAGAGSGKTRVITYRIAYMMKHHNVRPSQILAITFTNKAANEMRERITSLVGDSSRYIWCGTFHSIFARILRKHAELLHYSDNFTIVDTDDQTKLIKDAMKELDIDEKKFKPRSVQYEISSAKNKMITADDYLAESAGDYVKGIQGKIYKRYSEKLLQNNAMDFDDILINMTRLLDEHPDILELYQNKFRYIMVDEYQDTNLPQYRAVMLLAKGHGNICVVGDDDQSIYSFRGADVRMILNFEKDFPGCKVIKLVQNYRSTGSILEAANQVIANNRKRKKKELRTTNGEGDKIVVVNTDSQMGEADFVASTIKKFVDKGKFKFSDCAVLYRMNALSRSIESSLRQREIPFRVYGGLRFYDRKEIKDLLSYLRIINDTNDSLAFERIINVPRRGIGDTTIDRMKMISSTTGRSLFDIACHAAEFEELSRASYKLREFTDTVDEMRSKLMEDELNFAGYVEYVQDKSGLISEIIAQREKKGEIVDRVENLKELLTEAAEFDNAHRAEAGDGSIDELMAEQGFATASTTEGILALYVANAALYTDEERDDESDDYVRLMSIHSAKGLEFGAVFLVGAEETIFPSYRSIQTEDDLEEERRLMYVAITRAKKNLFVMMTRQRMLFGQTQSNMPSRFIKEISSDLLYKMGTKRHDAPAGAEQISPRRDEARRAISTALSTKFTGVSGNKNSVKAGSLMPDELVVGMKVRHDRFGTGEVLKVEPVGGDALITVDFDGMRKNMLAKAAGLHRA